MDFQVEVHGAVLDVAPYFDSFVGFESVKIIELVQTENADLPQTLVEELAFVDQKFAADDFVAGSGVPREIDAADVILFLLIKFQSDVDDFVRVVNIEIRFGRKVDEAILSIDADVIFHCLAQLGDIQHVALGQRENLLQCLYFERQGFVRIGAHNLQGPHLISRTFFNRNRDVHGLAVRLRHQGNGHAEFVAFRVDIFKERFFYQDAEIAVVLIETANADFEIFVELVSVEGFRENAEFRKVHRNCVRPVVAHGADQFAVAESMIAGEVDPSDFDFRAFFNFENQNHGVAARDAFDLRSDLGELPPVFTEKFL